MKGSDVASGAISHEEARERRRLEQEETTFFGSLDGASKFVKGDAIAGLLITLLNLIMGLAIGIFVHDMPLGRAFETYSILTVGDGLVNQIPAVVISIATAILLSKGGAVGSADQTMLKQLGGYPVALATVAGLMALFAFIPGLPLGPFLAGAIVLGVMAFVAQRVARNAAEVSAAEDADDAAPPAKTIGDILDLDEIHLEFGNELVSSIMEQSTGLDARIVNMRNHVAQEFGFVLPEIRLTDNPTLPPSEYTIRIQGVEAGRGEIETGKVLMLLADNAGMAPPGQDVSEPVYGAPARWIDPSEHEAAALAGFAVVKPTEVIAAHLLEVLKQNFGRLFSRRSLRRLLDEFASPSDPTRAAANKRILDEYVPDKVPVELLQSVTRLLLAERVSIRNLPIIFEAVGDMSAAGATPESLLAQTMPGRETKRKVSPASREMR